MPGVRDREPKTIITQAGGGGGFGWAAARTAPTSRSASCRRTSATRSSEQIARDLNRQLAGVIPGVIITTRASGGNQQMNRMLGGGGDSRIALEIRGDDLAEAQRVAQAAKAVMDQVPEVRNARVGRDDGRPELAIQVDRPKAALLGLSVTSVANSIRTSVGGTQAAFFREGGNEYPIIVRLREEDRERRRGRQRHPGQHAAGSGAAGEEPADAAQPVGTDRDPAQEPGADHPRHGRAGSDAERGASTAVNARLADVRVPPDFARRLRRRSRGAGARVRAAADDADPRDPARLRGHGVAVPSRCAIRSSSCSRCRSRRSASCSR